jgi:alpha-glucosidase
MIAAQIYSSCFTRPAVLALAVLLVCGWRSPQDSPGSTAKPAEAGPQTNQAYVPPKDYPEIQVIEPPADGFFTKMLSFHGILIKAPAVVVDEALYRAYERMARETAHLPMVVTNLAAAGGELHIIGRNQVTTDLPEWRQDKHVPLDEYNGLTRDARTRGMGGLITSCGEEGLLKLRSDRYFGNDICMHEFAHNIEGYGMGSAIHAKFNAQYQISKDKGRWLGSYAGSNPSEYFAELTVWYFDSQGSLAGMVTPPPRPEHGTEGLRKYDPEAFALFDEFYSGKMDIPKLEPVFRPDRPPRDSRPARAIVAHLTSYKAGETKLSQFFTDAGMAGPEDNGTNGWYVTQRKSDSVETNSAPAADATMKFNVQFHDPRPNGGRRGSGQTAAGTNTLAGTNSVTTGQGPRGNRGGGGRNRVPNLADLDFKDGVLANFKWNN